MGGTEIPQCSTPRAGVLFLGGLGLIRKWLRVNG
jgi:hypothetical protein